MDLEFSNLPFKELLLNPLLQSFQSTFLIIIMYYNKCFIMKA